MSAWGCPHDLKGSCQKVAQRPCDPGMKGCVLAGRYVFANSEEKNRRLGEKQKTDKRGKPINPSEYGCA